MRFYFPKENPTSTSIPLLSFNIAAGFPSPAADYVESRIDLNKHLVKNPSFTFFARAEGDSMFPKIQHGDLTVIDKKVAQTNGCVVLASVNNKLCFKRLFRFPDGSVELRPENPKYEAIQLSSEFEGDFEIFGKVLYSIHDVTK